MSLWETRRHRRASPYLAWPCVVHCGPHHLTNATVTVAVPILFPVTLNRQKPTFLPTIRFIYNIQIHIHNKFNKVLSINQLSIKTTPYPYKQQVFSFYFKKNYKKFKICQFSLLNFVKILLLSFFYFHKHVVFRGVKVFVFVWKYYTW